MPCKPLVRLSRKYNIVDNCRVDVFVSYGHIQTTTEVISLACDVWKSSTLGLFASFAPDWLDSVIPKIDSLILVATQVGPANTSEALGVLTFVIGIPYKLV